ncbi:hypothetical protein EYZ11_007791 [Aspergillus tanneri]|uniref:Glycosyltransferase 2-like domain-containing protein n=1 Tax=Aspergillus tanneri TaxID=1220188 RepID=A0A4S3JC46_9EURO|nr:hypothetical protein EYZ11_007791 [Aspergillus tanneri]
MKTISKELWLDFPILYLLLAIVVVNIFSLYWRNKSHRSPTSSFANKDEESKVHARNPIAIVIPTLHEATVLPETIAQLFATSSLHKDGQLTQHLEPTVVVVDAGRSDSTRARLAPLIAAHPTLHLLQYSLPPSRGAQQNAGAAHAVTISPYTSILLFLHADTLLPPAWDLAVLRTLSSHRPPALGTFTLSLPPPISLSLRLMLWGANLRARWGGLPYGDQAYFLTRRTFEAIGGFPDVPIMEDVELLRRVRSRVWDGRISVLEEQVVTSPRRWDEKGVLWNTVLNQFLVSAWLSGVSHATIYRWYYGRPLLPAGRTEEHQNGRKSCKGE